MKRTEDGRAAKVVLLPYLLETNVWQMTANWALVLAVDATTDMEMNEYIVKPATVVVWFEIGLEAETATLVSNTTKKGGEIISIPSS